jgi:hypothetical protein
VLVDGPRHAIGLRPWIPKWQLEVYSCEIESFPLTPTSPCEGDDGNARDDDHPAIRPLHLVAAHRFPPPPAKRNQVSMIRRDPSLATGGEETSAAA